MAYLNSRPRTPEICPVCGEKVPLRVLACPECGADHRSGWRPGALADDLPDDADDFDYKDFVNREFERPNESRPLHPVWLVTALLLLATLIALGLSGLW